MLGFFATAATTEITTDRVEILDARWFTRDELRREARERHVLLPPPISISRQLIEHWNGEPLDTGDGVQRT
jgi:NAD+ diphosphatase